MPFSYKKPTYRESHRTELVKRVIGIIRDYDLLPAEHRALAKDVESAYAELYRRTDKNALRRRQGLAELRGLCAAILYDQFLDNGIQVPADTLSEPEVAQLLGYVSHTSVINARNQWRPVLEEAGRKNKGTA